MEIFPLTPETLPEAAALFANSFRKQRQATPELPADMEEQSFVAKRLAKTFNADSAMVAMEGGKVIGFLGWFLTNNFRSSGRKGAYVPEWGHACLETGKEKIYRALYRRAAEIWATAGCLVHAITLLAHDHTAEKSWFWNGFGLTVIDAIRPMQPSGLRLSTKRSMSRGQNQMWPSARRCRAARQS